MMEKNVKKSVAGQRGMVGSAIVRELERQGYTNIVTRTHKELNLCRQDAVEAFFAEEKPEYVFLAAAKVGGIVANQNALADFMWFNMTLEMNVILARKTQRQFLKRQRKTFSGFFKTETVCPTLFRFSRLF